MQRGTVLLAINGYKNGRKQRPFLGHLENREQEKKSEGEIRKSRGNEQAFGLLFAVGKKETEKKMRERECSGCSRKEKDLRSSNGGFHHNVTCFA